MLSPELLRETLNTPNIECWERGRTATPVRAFAVHLHATGCSLRETQEILRLFGLEHSHQAVWQLKYQISHIFPDPPEAKPRRVAVDETAAIINGELCWVCAATGLDLKLILGAELFRRHGTDPAAAFL